MGAKRESYLRFSNPLGISFMLFFIVFLGVLLFNLRLTGYAVGEDYNEFQEEIVFNDSFQEEITLSDTGFNLTNSSEPEIITLSVNDSAENLTGALDLQLGLENSDYNSSTYIDTGSLDNNSPNNWYESPANTLANTASSSNEKSLNFSTYFFIGAFLVILIIVIITIFLIRKKPVESENSWFNDFSEVDS